MKLNTNAMKLNTNANEYIPESIKEENKKYDKLEKDFENENKWMFDIVVVDPTLEQIVPPNTPISVSGSTTPIVVSNEDNIKSAFPKSYAQIVKNNK
jgi:hypothetical protein